jgi:hypothetical protein
VRCVCACEAYVFCHTSAFFPLLCPLGIPRSSLHLRS